LSSAFVPPPGQDIGFRFVLSYGTVKPTLVLLYTSNRDVAIGFDGADPVGVVVDAANGTYTFSVDGGGPWLIQAQYLGSAADISAIS
jgi:hypothetical protein